MLTAHPKGQRVALFGGAFNPPHLAHLFTVTYLLSRSDIDEVWLIPSHRHVFNKQLLSFKHRVELLGEMCSSLSNVSLCLIEEEEDLSGRTFDTIELLSSRWPNHRFSLVIGSDNLNIADKWYKFDDLSKRWPLIVMQRPGYAPNEIALRYQERCDFGPLLPSISSSELRERLSDPVKIIDWRSEPLCWVPHTLRKKVLGFYGDNEVHQMSTIRETSEESAKTDLLVPRSVKEANTYRNSHSKVFIWGQGRCGLSLARAFIHVGIETKTASVRQLLDEANSSMEEVILDALKSKVWLIASRDQEIERVVHRLYTILHRYFNSENPPIPHVKLNVVAHCSGLSPRRLLNTLSLLPLKLKTGVFHPLFSFKSSKTLPESLKGAAFLTLGEESV